MSINTSRILPRRFERDTWWLVKHFIWPIAVRPYEHPEDFWFGSEELWIKKSVVKWKFFKLWWCYSMNAFSTQLFLSLVFHLGLLLLRSDIFDISDIFNMRKLPGVVFFGSLLLSAVVGGIAATEHLLKKT